jgi:hypothetical protein
MAIHVRIQFSVNFQASATLSSPVQIHRDQSGIFLLNITTAFRRPWQEQEFLLNFWDEVEECEDLRQSGWCYASREEK